MMGTVRGSLLAVVLILASPAPRSCSAPPPPACPHSCTCPTGALVNCSSSGLSFAPQPIQDSVTELDLSHNLLSAVTLHQPHVGLRGLWLSNNSIGRLSLCMGGGPGRRHVRGGRGSRPWNGRGCVSWAPTLQLLSVERNQLVQLPEGLHGSESLQVLQLSFNKITTLRPEDIQNLQQLRELHLQHNLITSLLPQIFQYLPHLKVLDVSFNMLTSLHPSTYLSLRNIGAEVSLHGNRWQCDCNLRSLRRWMVHDSSRGLQSWSVVCAAPSILSGTDLLELEDDDLNCFTTENELQLHQDVTVYSGSEILLSCSANDSFWWTTNTQRSGDRTNSHLFISDVTEKDAGIYVCVSDKDNVLSVYNLHISKSRGATRNSRSLPRPSEQKIPKDSRNRFGQERNLTATQSDLDLAVCLSVFITFLFAFILGVLLRPCIESCWRRVREKRSSPATNPATTVHERQYDNEAFCDGDDPEEARNFRERRVTFSTVEYREDNSVQYYDTLANGVHDSVNDDAVFDCEPPELQKQNGRSGTAAAEKTRSLKSAETKERRSSSSSSDSSTSDKGKVGRKRRTAPKPPRQEADAVQQRSESSSTAREVVVPQISIEGQSEIPGFSSEPFAEWSPHTSSTNLTDNTLCTGREEQFDFSDSNRSTPIRSSTPVGAFTKGGGIVISTSDIQRRDSSSSSSSSSLSDGEPSLYTVNPDPEEKLDTPGNKSARNAGHSVSSTSSDSDGQPEHTGGTKTRAEGDADVKAKHVMLKKWQAVNLAVPAHSESSAPAAPSASSDSDAEEETADLEMQLTKGRVNKGIQFREDEMPSTNLDDTSSSSSSGGEEGEKGRAGTDATAFQESQTHNCDPETKWPVIECENIPRVKTCLDVKTNVEKMSPVKNDGQWEGQFSQASHHPETQSPGKYLDIKATLAVSHSSSSSDSEDESNSEDKVSPTINHLTTLDLEDIPRVTRRLDIKVRPEVSSSSSDSDSDDNSKVNRKTQLPLLDAQRTSGKRRQDVKVPPRCSESSSSASSEDETGRPGKVGITGPLSPEPHMENTGQEKSWPSINLDITPIKRRLDIKAPPDSSSSSESEDEMKGQVIKKQEVIQMEKHPIEASKTQPQTHWPAVDLEQKVGIKRRLDFKVTTYASAHSFSNGSEDGRAKQEQEKTNTRKVASESSSSDEEDGRGVSPHPKTQWPLLDLERTTGVKRCLDFKAASKISDSSSSSDSEDERAGHNAGSQTVSRDANTTWPAIDLQHIPQVKRRLDIKKSSPSSDSSSSSDSEDETKKERPGEVGAVRPPLVESTIGSNGVETKWPSVNLDQIPPLKRRLDVKAPSSHLDSTTQIKKQEHGQTQGARPESDSSSSSDDEDVITVNPDAKTQWPTIDLEQIPRIKRRLDIKKRTQLSDSSSDSDSEDDANQKTQWPLLDLQHTTGIKRRLDVKAQNPAPDSSSSSSSEDETTARPGTKPGQVGIAAPQIQEQDLEKHPTKIETLQPQTPWPAVDLEQKLGIKRRLDIKVTPPASAHQSISDSEDRTADHIKEQEQKKIHGARVASDSSSSSDDEDEKAVNPGPKTDWPLLDLERTSGIKRRLDVKAASRTSASPSSSDSEEETAEQAERRPVTAGIVGSQAKGRDVNTTWPALDLERIPHIKRRLDIKASSRNIVEDKKEGTIKIVSEYAASSSDEEGISKDLKEARVAISSQSNSSESTVTEFSRLPESPVSPGATKDLLEKYAGSTEKQMPDNSGTKLEVNTELQSQWAAMNLGFSRFRKRLDITSHSKEPPKLPSSPPPDSSSSSSSDDDSEVRSGRTKGVVPQNKRPISTFLKTQDDLRGNPVHAVDGFRKDNSAVITERETHSPAGALRIRRSTDFKVSEKPSPTHPLQQHPSSSSSSSSSENENETTRKQQGPPTISQSSLNNNNTGIEQIGGRHVCEVPRLARRLDIKAPQRNSSPSSSSEDEKPKDESSQITYRRTVFKDSSLQSDAIPKLAVAEIATTTVQETSLSGAGVRKKSFRSFTEVDLPAELQWTGVGRRLSGTSGNRVVIRRGASPTSWQEAPPALPQQPPPPDSSDSSSSESDDNTERHRGKANIAQTRQYSSLASRGDSFPSTFDRPLDRVDTSFRAPNDTSFSPLQDRRERKGLSALKAMSSERQIWETEAQSISTSTSLNSDWGQQRGITFSHRRSEERTSLTKPSKSISSTFSASVRERRVADALFRYPSYRTHAIGDLKPPQDAAPPVPETSPPDEAVEITWRSRSNKTL